MVRTIGASIQNTKTFEFSVPDYKWRGRFNFDRTKQVQTIIKFINWKCCIITHRSKIYKKFGNITFFSSHENTALNGHHRIVLLSDKIGTFFLYFKLIFLLALWEAVLSTTKTISPLSSLKIFTKIDFVI